MWISKKRLEEIKKASYDDGLNRGHELSSWLGSLGASDLEAIKEDLNRMRAVKEAERIVRGL